ncbi:kinesin-like protein KIN-14S [Cucumis melo]|uniref:Kinesin-like protein n=1 Tax=Cucumis melo TaxID=3656 RepID=A0A1S3BZ28_CUCME|nr:kinesin-like protein KIN-14S [Cucumis melo]
MEDVMEVVSQLCSPAVPSCDSRPLPSISGSDIDLCESFECADKLENESSSETELTSSHGQHTLPILQKVIDLGNKIKNLKNEHMLLTERFKVETDAFPGPEVVETLHLLGTENERLKKKYLEESTERKRLYNEVIELKGNIRVFCRCRPLNQSEIENGSTSVIEFDSSQENEIQVLSSDSSKKLFKFDHVFKTEDSQGTVFSQAKPVVASVMDGYNVCIFAYGQTGTGKTFTMEGTPENRGVNYRTLKELFKISEDRDGVVKYDLYVSMLEVYNEKIRDLLADNSNPNLKKLEIKQAAEGTQEVPGLFEAQVYGTEEVWELLKSGSRARSVGSTSANEQSSRSHCLLRVTVKGENLINGQRTKSHLWLVDLAGSERVGRIDVDGERLKESQFINKSLSALGDVISALASKTAHIPYRNSKLTHLLQSSLGGDCKTLMFVQISPSAADVGETLCSLNFASRVRGIENAPARKQTDLTDLFKFKQMAEKSKHDEKEMKKLQDNVQYLQLRLAAKEHTCKNLQEKVRDLESQLAEERKARLKQENRALATVAGAASQPSAMQPLPKLAGLRTIPEKKPPLGPSKLRLPLRKITNFVPPTSPIPSKKRRVSSFINTAPPTEGKENVPKMNTTAAANTRNLRLGRRSSLAVRPTSTMTTTTTTTTTQVFQPKRRVSIATLRPELHSHMTTPLQTSASKFNNGNAALGAQLFAARKARYSKLFSPLPEFQTTTVEATPIAAMRSSSKFMGSPPTQGGGSRNGKVIALQRKPIVWSPLKLRGLKTFRRPSLIPSRPSSTTEFQ